MIVDEVTITVSAGPGGNGCSSFRREKYVPRGGPDGGSGGRGGDILLEATHDLHTLVDFLYHPEFKAKHGEHGKGKDMQGRDAEPVLVRVPVGTLVWDQEGNLLVDLDRPGSGFLAAKGGRGGRGNATFVSARNRAPRLAEKGEPGETKVLRLELKLLADVGLVGFPNAGKSTLLSRVTQARPKIADYPFTTLEPQLGVVRLSGERSFVMADVPGLLEGASQGKGLGVKFLRHLERTKVLLHLVELPTVRDPRDLEGRVRTIRRELEKHSRKFRTMEQVLVLTKVDAAGDKPLEAWVGKLRRKGRKVFPISAVTGQGLAPLMEATWGLLEACRRAERKRPVPVPERSFEAKARFKVEKVPEGFRVTGAELRKWIAMSRLEDRYSLERFQRIMGRMGVFRELKRQGAGEGDRVCLEEMEMLFTSGTLGRADEE
jgi:GTP-binding protein